ncbi:unknown protein [Seminavis robusta]|uniref:Uncharacterized protein n=1 Tax=Seminavis robusta TaxID=568900 RepID=A0A9N8HWT0_9STRA|nr:unknown protein [Seminavis robusta]|eukprot:Sro2296_g322370.1 n/a (374) ;mRNA; r:9151-11001
MAEAHQKAHGSKEDASAFFETLATDNNTAAAVGSPPRQQQERNPNQAQQPEVANNEDEEMQQLGQNHDNNNDFSTDLVGDSDLSEGSSDKDLDSAEYGGGYREAVKTYKKGIKKRVVLPIVLYIDGADTGAMKSMPVTAVKMALGIHTRKYRDQDQAWRVLGFVASAKKAKAKGGKILKQSGHVAAQQATSSSSSTALEEDDDDEEESKKVADDQGKPADFHAMLDVILESLVDVQKRGFVWDLRYKGRTWKDLEFVPYIAFVKCDNKEADTLCGAYNNYGKVPLALEEYTVLLHQNCSIRSSSVFLPTFVMCFMSKLVLIHIVLKKLTTWRSCLVAHILPDNVNQTCHCTTVQMGSVRAGSLQKSTGVCCLP